MDDERKALALQKARRLVERGKAERADVLADMEQRKSNDLTIPTLLPVDRGGLIYKRHDPHETSERSEVQPMPVSTPTLEWQSWINDRIDSNLRSFAQAIAEQMVDQNECHEAEIAALRAELARSRNVKPRKQKQLDVPPFLRVRGSSNAA